MPPLNPFSNRTTTSRSDYIQRKRNLTKIAFLKEMPWKNFKTRDYVVCDTHKCPNTNYPEQTVLHKSYPEPSYPYHLPHMEANLYYRDEIKDYTCPYNSSDVTISCETCGYGVKKMEISPDQWVCDNWKPPYTSCIRGNGEKLDNTVTAYCCQNVQNCNYIICDKCYSIKYANKEDSVNKLVNSYTNVIPSTEYTYPCSKIKPPTDFSKYPIVKMVKGHQELLDLTKGFYMTEPDLENRYPNSCQLKGEKPVNNICEARYSVLDLGKKCLYEDKKNILIENKGRTDKGLINLVGTVHQKQGDEPIFEFPVPLHKTTTFVKKENNHHPTVKIHKISTH